MDTCDDNVMEYRDSSHLIFQHMEPLYTAHVRELPNKMGVVSKASIPHPMFLISLSLEQATLAKFFKISLVL